MFDTARCSWDCAGSGATTSADGCSSFYSCSTASSTCYTTTSCYLSFVSITSIYSDINSLLYLSKLADTNVFSLSSGSSSIIISFELYFWPLNLCDSTEPCGIINFVSLV